MALKEISRCDPLELRTVSYDLGWQHTSQSQDLRMLQQAIAARLPRPGIVPRRSPSGTQGALRVMGSKLEFAAQKRGSDA